MYGKKQYRDGTDKISFFGLFCCFHANVLKFLRFFFFFFFSKVESIGIMSSHRRFHHENNTWGDICSPGRGIHEYPEPASSSR